MSYKVRIAHRADREIMDWLAWVETRNPAAALRIEQHLDRLLYETLSTFPRLGRPSDLIRPETRQIIFPPHHILFYTIDDAARSLTILSFFDARRSRDKLRL